MDDCVSVPGLPSSTFWASELQCEPHFAGFGNLETVHLFGEAILPGATYAVQTVHEGCGVDDDIQFSEPLAASTGAWGDVAGLFDVQNGKWQEPDGRVDVTTDIVALLDKFANRSGGPITAAADVAPATPDG